MLISHRYRFIYTKTKKTAGTSIELYFERFCMSDGSWEPMHARDECISESGIVGFRGSARPLRCKWWNHMTASEIRAESGSDVWNSYFRFCAVRNPFEKAISQFYFECKEVQFSEFCENHPRLFEEWLKTAHLWSDIEQYAINNQICMNYLIRHEQLYHDMEQVCNILNLPWIPDNVPRYKSEYRPKASTIDRMYSTAARAVVENAFAMDLRLLDYCYPEL